MCGAAGAARSAKSCSRSGLRLLGFLRFFADTDQLGAGRLEKYKAIRGNRFIEGGFDDRDLQLIVVAGPGDVNLPGVVKLAKRIPVAVTVVGGQDAAGTVGLDSRDIQIGAVEPDLLGDFEFARGAVIRIRRIGVGVRR